MEKLEIKKSIERTKAIVILTMIVLVLLIPSLLMDFSVKKATALTLVVTLSLLALFKRVRRLNYKLNLLAK